MCNEKETYIGKTIKDNTKGYEVRINQHRFDCKTSVSKCTFQRFVFNCGINNNNNNDNNNNINNGLEEPFFVLNIMLRQNKSGRLETIEKHFYLKGHDTMNNLVRN